MKTGLESLIFPMKLTQYRKHFLGNEPFMVQNTGEKIQEMLSLSFLTDVEALLSEWPKSVSVHLPDLRDEASSIDTDVQSAMKYFKEGMSLLFNDAQFLSPVMDEWLQEIRKDLGISALTYVRNLIYATPDGQGTAPHFDQNINFVLQVRGTKKWTVAANTHVMNPMTRHTMGQPADPEMMTYLEVPLPHAMPAETKSFELKPGCVLFVPRGCWHSTEAEGDALSLNFTFTAPTWVDLLTAALRGRLIQSAGWRETADLSEEKFSLLLGQLVEDLPNWKAGDILGATEA